MMDDEELIEEMEELVYWYGTIDEDELEEALKELE